ncbi:hypothetical protein H5410_013940 [Solanum commersonii]|uniref:SWIM-type domain-containing protein n=1 Tax=Solanum commersonii TaxID=4109 RepID=A0A9J5ZPV9_SOLCO|nr:hypothetical protein H5410_013940 [Solanum commersonii]
MSGKAYEEHRTKHGQGTSQLWNVASIWQAKEVAARKWKAFMGLVSKVKFCLSAFEDFQGHRALAFRHIVNLRERKCICKDLTEIPCPHAIKAMEHKKMIPKNEIDWYYSKEAALVVYKHKLQPAHPSLSGKKKNEAVKRQGVWKQTRKGKVMTCSNCGEQNHNARGCEKAVRKQPTRSQGITEDDDEDPRLRPRTILEEVFLTRSVRRNP